MRITTIAIFFLTILCAAWAQDSRSNSVPFTSSLSGAEMFKTWCASCHGTDAKGNGPALKTMPSNLTLLAKQNGGKFPTQRVREYIDGTGKAGSVSV